MGKHPCKLWVLVASEQPRFEVYALQIENKSFQPWVNLKSLFPWAKGGQMHEVLHDRRHSDPLKADHDTDWHRMQMHDIAVEQHRWSSSWHLTICCSVFKCNFTRPYSFKASWLLQTTSCSCREGFEASLKWNNGLLNHAWDTEIL